MKITAEQTKMILDIFTDYYPLGNDIRESLLALEKKEAFPGILLSFIIGGINISDIKKNNLEEEFATNSKKALEQIIAKRTENRSAMAQEVTFAREESEKALETVQEIVRRLDAKDEEIKESHRRELASKNNDIREAQRKLDEEIKSHEDTKAKMERIRGDLRHADFTIKKLKEERIPKTKIEYVKVPEKRGILSYLFRQESEPEIIPKNEPEETRHLSSEDFMPFMDEIGHSDEYSTEIKLFLMDAMERGIPYTFIRDFISPNLSLEMIQAVIERYERIE